jgi:tripartite ATP-independent transporter DctM subunit
MTAVALGGIALLFLLLASGMPVAFALLVAGGVGMYFAGGVFALIGVLKSGPYEVVASYTLSTLPMFVLVGSFLTAGEFTRDLFNTGHRWLGHIRGGLAYAAVAGGVLLAAISGSSAAAAAMLAKAAYPQMKRYGYSDSFSTGTLAVVGTLAIMIPPSIGFVLYGVFTETSIGKLLVAGIIPGLLTAIGYAVTIRIVLRRNPELAPVASERFPMRERIAALRSTWPLLLLMVMMIGGIYSGAVTPTEVGAVGASFALLMAVVMGRMGWQTFRGALADAARTSAMILTIVATSAVFGTFLTLTGTTQAIIGAVQSANIHPYAVLFAVMLFLILLGCFLEQMAILVLTLPLIFPLLTSLGFDPIWLGVLYVKSAEIGFITPPMGMNGFVIASATGVPTRLVFKGIWPFVLVEVVLLILLVAFPQLTLWLPGRM